MRFICCSLALLLAAAAPALWVPPDDTIPVERLIENLEKQLEATPDDPHLLARLGRIHSLRYALGDQKVDVRKDRDSDALQLYERGHGYPATRHGVDAAALPKRIPDLYAALDYYKRAVEADPDEAYIWLGLGYTCDELSHAAPLLAWPESAGPDSKDIRAELRIAWEDKALEAYRRAMGRSPSLQQGGFLTPPVELEAARYITKILGSRDHVDRRHKSLLRTAQDLQKEGARMPRMVTPIIFPVDQDRPLSELLAPDRVVSFDLDGTESGRRWPWVQPDTALLVWDADGRGDVLSGRQLIGSVTWWLFWENGYAVLGALDNDGDGWLRGAELDGLAAWQDRNSNGVSDAGEVKPLGAFGITGLATSASGSVDGMPMNRRGIELAGGGRLPSYDWIVSPLPEEDAR